MKKGKILGYMAGIAVLTANLGACGGDTDRICVVTREEGSGTRGSFVEIAGIEETDKNGNKADATTPEAICVNGTAITTMTVAGNKQAIGYISLGSLDESVKPVKIDGIEADVYNIKNGSYTLVRPFYLVTKENLSKAAQDFMNFILSEDGQAVVMAEGYAQVEDIGAFTGNLPTGKVTVTGSSSVAPIMQKLQEAYQSVHPDVKVEIQESDSTTGIISAANEICDMGMTSRELKEKENQWGLVTTQIAIDGIVVVVHKKNETDNLSMKQLRDIFTGKVTKWSEVK